jgi:arabinofuranosyltransferase
LRWYKVPAVYVNDKPLAGGVAERPTIVSFGIGIAGYSLGTDVDIVDLLGLAEPLAAHEELRVRSFPGHEKLLPAPWIAALVTRRGTPVRAADFPTAPPPFSLGFKLVELRNQDDPRGRPFETRVADAREALACTTLAQFRSSYLAPLTPRRFLSNIVHSFAHTRLSIPAEPADAVAKFCR